MNVVNSGSVYQIYDEGMQTSKKLPSLVYDVCFSKMQGFFLTARSNIKAEEEKVYGNYIKKVNKVLSGYKAVDRNFGVILSGPKGVGKTLFTKVLSAAAQTQDYPILVVSSYVPGISHFIGSIDQDVIVLFDEFEKTFANSDDCCPQDEMLSLFDGLDSGHKLFVVTCNDTGRLNDYLLNRPGRFHYHFILDVPSAEEIREYLSDKLAPPYQDAIDDVINFSNVGKITYDCLRAIAFELNQGYSLEETLEDLNLIRDRSICFNIIVEFMDGTIYKVYSESLDLMKEEIWGRWFRTSSTTRNDPALWLAFSPRDVKPNPDHVGEMQVPVDKVVNIHYDRYDFDDDNADDKETKAIIDARIKNGLKSVRLIRDSYSSYKYLV